MIIRENVKLSFSVLIAHAQYMYNDVYLCINLYMKYIIMYTSISPGKKKERKEKPMLTGKTEDTN